MTKHSSLIISIVFLFLMITGLYQLWQILFANQYEKRIFQINNYLLTADIASTDSQRKLGLGGRSHLAENKAMFFVFPSPEPLGFWMKGMLLPIDIIWLDDQCRVIHVEVNLPPCPTTGTCPIYMPATYAQYVLETSAGFAQKHDLTIGQKILECPDNSRQKLYCPAASKC